MPHATVVLPSHNSPLQTESISTGFFEHSGEAAKPVEASGELLVHNIVCSKDSHEGKHKPRFPPRSKLRYFLQQALLACGRKEKKSLRMSELFHWANKFDNTQNEVLSPEIFN